MDDLERQERSLRRISQEEYAQITRRIREQNDQAIRKFREIMVRFIKQLRGEGLTEEEVLETVVWATLSHYREEGMSETVLDDLSPSISQMVKNVMAITPRNTTEENT